MNIRWLWLDHVPPELEISAEARTEILRLAKIKRRKEPGYRSSQRDLRRLMIMTFVPASIIFTAWIFTLIWLKFGVAWFVVANVTGILLFNALIWACIAWAMYRTNVPYVRWALCQIGRPVCIGCGYILTGAEDAARKCPECGEVPEASAMNTAEQTK